jgi:hypothetical protein
MTQTEGIVERFGLRYLTEPEAEIEPISSRTRPSSKVAQGQSSTLDARVEAFASQQILKVVQELQLEKAGGKVKGRHARFRRSGGEAESRPGVWLHEVTELTGMDGEILIPMQRRLEALGLMEVRQEDPKKFGDNLVSLTRRGEELLSPGSLPELMEVLNPK